LVEIEDFGIAEYSFSISGHRKRYNLTTVLHLFGEKFAEASKPHGAGPPL
jgi:hypothetical protein